MNDDRVPPTVHRRPPPPPQGHGPGALGRLAEDPRMREAAQTLSRALNEGLTRIADSLDNAVAGSRVTGRVLRELGAWEREHGVSSYPDGTGPETMPIKIFDGLFGSASELASAARHYCDVRARTFQDATWRDVLMSDVFDTTAQSPDLDDPGLDDALLRLAATTVSWLKDRENRRAERDRERLSDLAEHGYDTTEGP